MPLVGKIETTVKIEKYEVPTQFNVSERMLHSILVGSDVLKCEFIVDMKKNMKWRHQ